jgi:hypothetical protein
MRTAAAATRTRTPIAIAATAPELSPDVEAGRAPIALSEVPVEVAEVDTSESEGVIWTAVVEAAREEVET